MEDIVQKAKNRLLELEAEANELRAFIRTYEKLSGEKVTAEVDMTQPTKAAPNDKDASGQADTQQFSSRDEIVAAARAVLKAAHPQPVLIGDLFSEVIAMGIRIPGSNPKGNLSAKLSPPKDLEYVRHEGWYYRPEKDETPSAKPRVPRFAGGDHTSPNMLSDSHQGVTQFNS